MSFAVVGTPVELGGANLMPADPVKQGQKGPVTARSRVLGVTLRAGVAAPDVVCGAPADLQANVERPDARALVPPASDETRALVDAGADAGGVGLVLVHAGPTGYCEAFHLLYDGTALAWWRAAPPGQP